MKLAQGAAEAHDGARKQDWPPAPGVDEVPFEPASVDEQGVGAWRSCQPASSTSVRDRCHMRKVEAPSNVLAGRKSDKRGDVENARHTRVI